MQLTMLAKSPSIKKMTIVHACVSVPAEHSTLRALLCGSLPAAAGLLPAGRARLKGPHCDVAQRREVAGVSSRSSVYAWVVQGPYGNDCSQSILSNPPGNISKSVSIPGR